MQKKSNYTDLEEQIYLICLQPRYPGEIQELLTKSGRTTKPSQLLIDHPDSYITKLIKKGWLKQLTSEEKEKIIKNIKDGRAKKRNYFCSTLTPLISYFKSQIQLGKNEERQLIHLFEKKTFRLIITWENGFNSFSKIKEFLHLLTLWRYISIRYTEPYRLGEKDLNKIEEKKLINKLIKQVIEKSNSISDRVAPQLKIELTNEKTEMLNTFYEDIFDKLKHPLSDRILELPNNNPYMFQIMLMSLACGEFISEFQREYPKQKQRKT